MRDLEKSNSIETESRVVVATSWDTGELLNGYRVSTEKDEKVLDMDGGSSCTTL